MAPSSDLSFLDILNLGDNQQLRTGANISESQPESLVPFLLTPDQTSERLGLLRPQIVNELRNVNASNVAENKPPLFFFSSSYVSLDSWLDTPYKRTTHLRELCERWRDAGTFSGVCGPSKWRDERYPVYKRPFGPHDHPSAQEQYDSDGLNYAFELERSCCALFGIVTYGVHMTIYEHVERNGVKDIAIWVPTRSKSKPTFPGMLDNTVAGGIPSGMSAFESLIKECEEEASLPRDVVAEHAKSVGSISYFFRTSQGWLQPEIEYVYDIAIPAGVDSSPFKPKPSDGEVESFELLDRKVVIERMRSGLFKPNCALVVLDLLIRLGYMTPDNEPDFMEIITRLHGRFDYDSW